jgi:hypothetical protein
MPSDALGMVFCGFYFRDKRVLGLKTLEKPTSLNPNVILAFQHVVCVPSDDTPSCGRNLALISPLIMLVAKMISTN